MKSNKFQIVHQSSNSAAIVLNNGAAIAVGRLVSFLNDTEGNLVIPQDGEVWCVTTRGTTGKVEVKRILGWRG